MNLANVMDELATQLDTIPELHVYAYEADSIVEPAAIIDFPEEYNYDQTYGRGSDRMTVMVHAIISNSFDRTSKERLGKYTDGSGVESFKQVLENGVYTSFDTIRVMSVRFNPFLIGQIEYKGATFLTDIFGVG